MLLNRQQIEELIQKQNLIEAYCNLERQLTPNGFDLTVNSIAEFQEAGALDFSNKERRLPQTKEIIPQKQNPQDKYGWWILNKGAYKVKTNEIISLPNDLVAFCFCRTSLLRMGAFTQHGVWDAGFRGRGEFVLVVENPYGIKLKQNARIAQLVFFKIDKPKEVYQGIYQNKV